MKYDEQFPDAEIHSEPLRGIVKVKATAPCVECDEECNWVHLDFEIALCSFECTHAYIQNYLKAETASWVGDSLLNLNEAMGHLGSGLYDANTEEVGALLTAQHHKSMRRMIEWAQSERLVFFYVSAPTNYPFAGEIPLLPTKVIEWESVESALGIERAAPLSLAAPVEEIVIEEVMVEEGLNSDTDEEVWMGSELVADETVPTLEEERNEAAEGETQ